MTLFSTPKLLMPEVASVFVDDALIYQQTAMRFKAPEQLVNKIGFFFLSARSAVKTNSIFHSQLKNY